MMTKKDILSSCIYCKTFKVFLDKNTNRSNFICSWLKEYGVPFSVVNIAEKKHIVVSYNSNAYDSQFKIKTLTAHYDRVTDSEGANDNSAACFQLMIFAKNLLLYRGTHNIKIIFTDGEEAGAHGIAYQGAYKLGAGLKKLGMSDSDIFVFDMCGRGDVLILSQSGIFGRAQNKTSKLHALHSRACLYAEKACSGKWFSLLTPYSDNAGFVAAGLTAQAITVLPSSEAEILLHYLQSAGETALKELTGTILRNKKLEKDSFFQNAIPQTWKYMHTENDTINTLTPTAYTLVWSYLEQLTHENERI